MRKLFGAAVAFVATAAPLSAIAISAFAADITSGGGVHSGTNIRLVDRLGPAVGGRSTLVATGLTLDAGIIAIGAPPTPIAWLSLSAETPAEGGVRLGWSVTPDSDPVGFLVDRGTSAAGPWERLTATPLAPTLRDFRDAGAPAGIESWYRLTGIDRRGALFTAGPIAARPLSSPLTFSLGVPTPNPSSSGTALLLDLPSPRAVELRVFDASGRLVSSPLEAPLPAGRHELRWDGVGPGGPVAAGVYFLRLIAGDRREVRRVVIRR